MPKDPYLKYLEPHARKRFEFLSYIIALLLQNQRIAAIAFEIGELARFAAWGRKVSAGLTPPVRRYRTREDLWTHQALPLGPIRMNGKIMVAEFGVASGVGARWWLKQIPSPSLIYHGFDTFQGMPEDFKGVPKGGLSLGGQPPSIDDKRIVWHVGDVSATVNDVDWSQPSQARIFLFDLDLYSPSLSVWETLSPHFRAGDVIYFDEAYNENEFRLIREKVAGHPGFQKLGFTAHSLLCKYRA